MEKADEADLLYGVPAIASHLNLTTRQVYHLIAKGELPAFKIGGKACARRSSLTAWLSECEANARKAVAHG